MTTPDDPYGIFPQHGRGSLQNLKPKCAFLEFHHRCVDSLRRQVPINEPEIVVPHNKEVIIIQDCKMKYILMQPHNFLWSSHCPNTILISLQDSFTPIAIWFEHAELKESAESCVLVPLLLLSKYISLEAYPQLSPKRNPQIPD